MCRRMYPLRAWLLYIPSITNVSDWCWRHRQHSSGWELFHSNRPRDNDPKLARRHATYITQDGEWRRTVIGSLDSKEVDLLTFHCPFTSRSSWLSPCLISEYLSQGYGAIAFKCLTMCFVLIHDMEQEDGGLLFLLG